jgi:hypothetical protein
MGFYYRKFVKLGGHLESTIMDRRPFPLSAYHPSLAPPPVTRHSRQRLCRLRPQPKALSAFQLFSFSGFPYFRFSLRSPPSVLNSQLSATLPPTIVLGEILGNFEAHKNSELILNPRRSY